MDIMKGFKWVVGWKDKEQLQAQAAARQERQEYRQLVDNPPKLAPKMAFPKTMPDPVRYPLPPVASPKPLKRIPSHLLPKRRYRNL